MTKHWRNLPYDDNQLRQVWCDEIDFHQWQKQPQTLAPPDWLKIYKSRDDGPLFYYPTENQYLWFLYNEHMDFGEWVRRISFNRVCGPLRTDEEIAMLVLTYA